MLVISSNCLDANIPKMYDVIAEVINETNWNDLSHLKSVIASSSTELMNSLAQSGHGYAMRASSSLQSLSQHYSEIYSGIAQVNFMGHLHSNIDSILPETSDRLGAISHLLKNSALKFSVNTEAAMQNSHRYQISRFSGCLNICPTITEKSKSKFQPIGKSIQKFFSVPFSVFYTGKSYRCVPYNHSDGPALQTLAHLMTNKYLHLEIREKGGAYGGRAIYNPLCGTFEMMSYRDPQVFRTVETYNNAVEWSYNISKNLNLSDLNEAKLNIFQVGSSSC